MHVELTKEMAELRDELLANLVDQYEELIDEGWSEEKAYIESIKSIGNLNEIIKQKKQGAEQIIPEKKTIDQLLYANTPADEYTFDQSINKFQLFSLISYGLVGFSGILFFLLIYLIDSYKVQIASPIQLTLILCGSIVFTLGYQRFNRLNQQIYKVYRNKDLWIKGIITLKKQLFNMVRMVILIFSIVLPHIITSAIILSSEQPVPTNSLMTFSSYLEALPFCFIVGLLVYAVATLILNYLWKKQYKDLQIEEKNNWILVVFIHHSFVVVPLFMLVFILSRNSLLTKDVYLILAAIFLITLIVNLMKHQQDKQLIYKLLLVSIQFICLLLIFLYYQYIESFEVYKYTPNLWHSTYYKYRFNDSLFQVLFITYGVNFLGFLITTLSLIIRYRKKQPLQSFVAYQWLLTCWLLFLTFISLKREPVYESDASNVHFAIQRDLLLIPFILFIIGYISLRLFYEYKLKRLNYLTYPDKQNI